MIGDRKSKADRAMFTDRAAGSVEEQSGLTVRVIYANSSPKTQQFKDLRTKA
jgi:hypothetical protein